MSGPALTVIHASISSGAFIEVFRRTITVVMVRAYRGAHI